MANKTIKESVCYLFHLMTIICFNKFSAELDTLNKEETSKIFKEIKRVDLQICETLENRIPSILR